MHEHPRFATLVPIELKLIAPLGATLPDVRLGLEAVYKEAAEKLNAWWNQKDTEHVRARYVGSRFLYNEPRFKLMSASSSHVWTEKIKSLDDFLKECSGSTTVKSSSEGSTARLRLRVSMRMLRPASERRCVVM